MTLWRRTSTLARFAAELTSPPATPTLSERAAAPRTRRRSRRREPLDVGAADRPDGRVHELEPHLVARERGEQLEHGRELAVGLDLDDRGHDGHGRRRRRTVARGLVARERGRASALARAAAR